MRLLAFDTALDACSAALLDTATGELLAARWEEMPRGQSERLFPMIDEVLDEAAATYLDLGAIAVTVGPGGFTGVRIGLAAARALALALDRPVVGVTTLEAVAAAAGGAATPCLVALESKRDDLYVQAFAPPLVPLGAPAAVAPAALAAHLAAALGEAGTIRLAGDAQERAAAALVGSGLTAEPLAEVRLPTAADVARLAAKRAAEASPGAVPAPLYLRPPDAKPAADPKGRRRDD